MIRLPRLSLSRTHEASERAAWRPTRWMLGALRSPRWRRWGLAIVVIVTVGCQTVPMSGRRRAPMLTSEAKEIELGKQAFAQMMSDGSESLSTNAEAAAMVQRVGERIAAVSGRPDYEWEFKLFAGDTVNAFCLPGGKVAIYEGILPVCQSEAGLAVVMSHEVAHALARHGGERMNHEAVKNGLQMAGGFLLNKSETGSSLSPQQRQMISGAYGVASKYGVILPYSRKHESEADLIGLELMAQAGYDPSEAPHFWDRFSQVGGSKPPEFFSTHPSDARRAADLRERLPSALATYNAAASRHGLGDAIPGVALGSGDSSPGAAPPSGSGGLVTAEASQSAGEPADSQLMPAGYSVPPRH